MQADWKRGRKQDEQQLVAACRQASLITLYSTFHAHKEIIVIPDRSIGPRN